MNKATKIVATIGPATETEEIIEQLILNGMNVARFNTKHSTPDWHRERMQRVRNVSNRLHIPVAILLDLQGPEIRINTYDGKSFEVVENEPVSFQREGNAAQEKTIYIPQEVIDALAVGDKILIDDGLGEFEIVEKDHDRFVAIAMSSFLVGHRKTLNTPSVVINMPSLIEQDIVQLDGIDDELVDFVALSFVRDTHDIDILRNELEKRNLHCHVVSKIENEQAIQNIDSIIPHSDAIMVARGDLAVEVAFEQLTHWQKLIVRKSREHAKPVIVATQMLKSMVQFSRPTRAEVSDVANAVYDGADAVMLSEETTIGKYPVKAVRTQAIIAEYNEPFVEPIKIKARKRTTTSYITEYAVKLYEESRNEDNSLRVDAIVLLTESGKTARLFARYRPHSIIHVLTSTEQTYHTLSLIYGVVPHLVSFKDGGLESSEELLKKIRDLDIAQSGESVLLVHGTHWKQPGLTNTLSVITLP